MLTLVLNIIMQISAGYGSVFGDEVHKYLQQRVSGADSIYYSFEEEPSALNYFEINYERQPNRIGNCFYIPVRTSDDNGVLKDRFLVAKVRLFKNVLVAESLIAKGKIIDESNSGLRLKDITELVFQPYENDEQMGIKAKQDLQPGAVICNNHIEFVPVINVGDKVNLKYEYGSITISMIGIARQAGITGDAIKFRVNNQQYSARVVNSQTAIIIE